MTSRLKLFVAAIAVILAFATLPSQPWVSAREPAATKLLIPWSQDDGSLTPYSFQTGYPLMTLVYDTLLWHDAQDVPRPWLARSIQMSSDASSLTLELVDSARWHDGKPVTSADVVFTFKMFKEHPHNMFTPDLASVSRVSAPGSHTVRIQLTRASPGFLYQPLSQMPILPKHVWEGTSSVPAGPAIGSGPYRLTYEPGTRYRFDAVADYFKGRPHVDHIEVPIVASTGERLTMLTNGKADALPFSLPDRLASTTEGLGIQLARGPYYVGTVLAFNTRRPPFDRAEVRAAASKALDLRRVTLNAGGSVPADAGYIHPASIWAPDAAVHRFAEGQARAEFSRLGVGSIEILAPDDEGLQAEAGRQVALAFERAGIKADLRLVGSEALARATGKRGDPAVFQAAISDLLPYPSNDPDYLRKIFGSDPRSAFLNFTGYRSAAFEAAAERVATTNQTEERRAATAHALKVIADEAPLVPLFFSGGVFAYRPLVYDGWVFMRGSGILDKRSFVEPRTRPGSSATVTAISEADRPRPLGWIAAGLLVVAALIAFRLRR